MNCSVILPYLTDWEDLENFNSLNLCSKELNLESKNRTKRNKIIAATKTNKKIKSGIKEISSKKLKHYAKLAFLFGTVFSFHEKKKV
tara:strand:+ start:1861 stop:2121 length:261 start_codon:yes stop_codon:yes gene_type:complete